VSLNNAVVSKQRVLRDVDLSDHYPVVASLAVKHITAAPDKLIYDRLKLQLIGKTAAKILSDRRWLTCRSGDVSERAKQLHLLVEEISLEHGIRRARCERTLEDTVLPTTRGPSTMRSV
ncbi:putative transposable element encoded protein, partial [Trachipleistophora hominis]